MFRITSLLMLTIGLGAVQVRNAEQCSGAEYRQLDFVIGNWVVSDRSETVTGTVTISSEYNGCALVETWRGVGNTRESLGVTGYRASEKKWHRDFVDPDGFILAVDGQWNGRSLVFTGKDYHSPDVVRLHRITWMATSDGMVEQLWRTSVDSGRTWRLVRCALMRRISE